MAILHFKPDKLYGFESSNTAFTTGDSLPIIRELVQNALDAAKPNQRGEDRTPVEVKFIIERIQKEDIPLVEIYEDKLDKAIATQKECGIQGKDEEIKDSMKACIQNPDLYTFYCVDNGKGIDTEAVTALLTEGRSYKKDSNHAGSFGLGHLQAFAATDLRYIMYAGRSENQKAGQGGGLTDIASGHVILASFEEEEELYGPEGYLLEIEHKSDLFSVGTYLAEAPPILKAKLDELENTGSVVAIPGFNFFREDKSEKAIQQIKEVCVLNYFAAIQNRRLKIALQFDGKTFWELDEEKIKAAMGEIAENKNASVQGGISGYYAKSAFDVMNAPEHTQDYKGCRVFLKHSTDGKTQVHIIRNGMWITRSAPNLKTNNFPGIKPVTAVILASEEPGNQLIQRAEGPLHLTLDPKRLRDPETKARFRNLISSLKEIITGYAGELESKGTYIPDFLNLNIQKEPKLQDPFRPRVGQGTGGHERKGSKKGRRKKDSSNLGAESEGSKSPSLAPILPIKTTYIPNVSNDKIRKIKVSCRSTDSTAKTKDDLVVLRAFIDNGSDGSCDTPLPTDWVSFGKDPQGNNILEKDVTNQIDKNHFDLELENPLPPNTPLKIELVKRKKRDMEK